MKEPLEVVVIKEVQGKKVQIRAERKSNLGILLHNEQDYRGGYFFKVLYSKIVPFGNEYILAFQMRSRRPEAVPYVVVPGKLPDFSPEREEYYLHKVIPISNEEKKKIKEILKKESFEGEISFW